jgi:ABC-2 type transport system ATP-binding protein
MSVLVKEVTKVYGKQRALDAISFEVNTGQVVGLLGPNGAGKSTLMKIISCYLPQSQGTVKVCGFDVVPDSIKVREHVGYLPEHNPLYLDMYVKEYLQFIGGIHMPAREAAKRTDEMIALTGLTLEYRKKIGALSKGYRQRVGLAQALIHDPEVLILDEPTSGLDPNQLSEIRTLIKSIGKQKTIILSTHIMQEVEAICSRVIIINKGKIVADDDTHILRQKIKSENTIRVEFDRIVKAAQFKTIDAITHTENLDGNIWLLTFAGEEDIRKDIFNFAVTNNMAVLSMQKEERKLEDIFQQLTL